MEQRGSVNMSGLDKILSKIIADAEARANIEIDDANEKASAMLEEASKDARAQAEKRLETASFDAQAIIARSHSAAKLASQRLLLLERNHIIDEALNQVKDSICSLPDEDYFLMIKNFVLSHLHNEPGTIVLNKRDQLRLPAGFTESLSESLTVPLTVSETSGDFDAGCVLIYGDIEYNGTITALINEKRDVLRDLLNKELFT